MILNLDPTFKPTKGEEISFESFVFNGGEPHIRIENIKLDKVHVSHRINSFNDLGLLCLAIDALKRMSAKEIHLTIPYFPGARQDRLMVPGESLSVKVYTNIINTLELNSITILDPHSDVTPALLDNCIALSNHKFIDKVKPQIPEDTILISPDAGASKKIFKLANALNFSEVLECGKKRDIITGELTGFTVPVDDLKNRACIIVDDICDGGGTFLGLGAELKKRNAGKLYLAVSHGIFSKGFDQLSSVFEKIFTTDSIQNINNPQIEQIHLTEILNLNK